MRKQQEPIQDFDIGFVPIDTSWLYPIVRYTESVGVKSQGLVATSKERVIKDEMRTG